MSQVIVILTATDLIRQDDGLFSLDNVTKHSFKIDRRLLEAKLVIYSNGLGVYKILKTTLQIGDFCKGQGYVGEEIYQQIVKRFNDTYTD